MNAHINYDLPQALLAVITDEEFADPVLLARREADHRAIDDVLASRVGAEGDELAGISGPGSSLDRLLAPLNRRGTRRFLREAREKVWANAVALSHARASGPRGVRERPPSAFRAERGQGDRPAGTGPGPAETGGHRVRRPAAIVKRASMFTDGYFQWRSCALWSVGRVSYLTWRDTCAQGI